MKDLKIIGVMLLSASIICKYIKFYSYIVANQIVAAQTIIPSRINKELGGVSWRNLQVNDLEYDTWLFYIGLILIILGIVRNIHSSKKIKSNKS